MFMFLIMFLIGRVKIENRRVNKWILQRVSSELVNTVLWVYRGNNIDIIINLDLAALV